MRRLLWTVMLLGVVAVPTSAQERNTGFMVHQFSICSAEALTELNRISPTVASILNGLRDEGMISSWFDIRHAWGDEYNLGLVTVAESHEDWLAFWSEYLSRLRAQLPEMETLMPTLCTVHKDNMYRVRDMGVGE